MTNTPANRDDVDLAAGDFDPLSPEMQRDPHAVYRDLRERCPVARSERWDGFWMLTRFDDVVAVTRNHELFLNSVQNVVPAVVTTGKRPPLHLDPPEHTAWRKAMSGPFKRPALAALEPTARNLTVEQLSPLIARGHSELVADLTATLPVRILCAFLNLPGADAPEQLRESGTRFLRAFQQRDFAVLEQESRKLYAVASALLELRKREPLDPAHDMATALLHMNSEEEPVSEALTQGALRQLLLAGHVAVTMMLGSAALHLAREPELQRELRREPGRVDAAIDELLRLYTPNQGFCRTAARQVELHGASILPRQPVVVSYPAANRDPERFEQPEQFRFDRPHKHVAFGNGVHKCPGEPLARLELRIFCEELLARTRHFELAGEVELAPWPEYGPHVLPLRLEAV